MKRSRADSPADRRAPRARTITAQAMSAAVGMPVTRVSLAALGQEGQQEAALEVEHLLLLLGLGVVVAQEVEDAVDGEQEHLLDGGVAGGQGLLGGDLRAQDDVAQGPGGGGRVG